MGGRRGEGGAGKLGVKSKGFLKWSEHRLKKPFSREALTWWSEVLIECLNEMSRYQLFRWSVGMLSRSSRSEAGVRARVGVLSVSERSVLWTTTYLAHGNAWGLGRWCWWVWHTWVLADCNRVNSCHSHCLEWAQPITVRETKAWARERPASPAQRQKRACVGGVTPCCIHL